MSLALQTRIGPYEVIAKLGQGGMGEVYRARDARLDRDVAIKILPALFASDPERLARFDREAKTLAALSHPNIAAIFGVESRALVMELVEGEDLSAWIARGPMALADALPIARQIADALEAAHESGIVHRDLKPANIKVRPDGTVKVLDFGLAKAMGGDASGAADPSTSPTLTARATQMGMIIGTAAYMAPEQARGRSVDRRADIWAFGVVLYEMLSGRRAFEGDDISITLASVLKEDVAWDALPADLPPSLHTLLRRCLEKDPRRRLGWIGEARHTLEDPEAAPSLSSGRAAGDSGAQSMPAAAPPKWRRALVGAAALAFAATAAWAAWMLKPDPPSGIVARFDVPFAEGVGFTRAGRRTVAISPDGRRIAFIANQQIYVRQMHEDEAQPVRGSDVDPAELAFSPEGDWLAFFVPATPQGSLGNAVLKKIPTTGGSPLEVTPADAPFGLRWHGDTIIFSTGNAIMTVAAAGGTPDTLVTAPEGERLAQPQLLNDGRDVLYTISPTGASFNDARIVVRPVAGGEPTVLVTVGSDGRVLPSGHLVYVRDNNLLAQPFDEDRLEVLGSAVPVVERVRFTSTSGVGQFDVAANGTLVFATGSADGAFRMVWVDRSGKEEAIAADAMSYYMPRVSPDGTKVAITTLGSVDEGDIWIWNDERKRMTRFTSDANQEGYPVWAADSQSVYYRANPSGNFDIFRRAVEGAGAAEQLTDTPGAESPMGLLPGGTQLLVRAGQSVTDFTSTLMTLSVTPPAEAEPLLAPVVSMFGEVSPDGRWLLYQAVESSTEDEVWVRPFPAVDGGRWQVSSAGGTRPTWSRSGREIFYVAREGSSFRLMSVPVQPAAPGAPFAYGAPAPLFDVARFVFPSVGRTYDVAPGDQRFVFLSSQTAASTEERGLTVIVNWLEDLRARVRR